MRQFSPFELGKTFMVLPPGETAPETEKQPLWLQSGAFGSGEHETTASCIELMESLPELTGAQVLDLGTGTGILSIAAVYLGAQQIVGVDIEAQAVQAAQTNALNNHCHQRCDMRCGSLEAVPETGFDVVLANIYADILQENVSSLLTRVRSEGILLLSGIPFEDNYDLRQLYTGHGCQLLRNHMLEDFSSILLRAPRQQ